MAYVRTEPFWILVWSAILLALETHIGWVGAIACVLVVPPILPLVTVDSEEELEEIPFRSIVLHATVRTLVSGALLLAIGSRAAPLLAR